MQQNTFWLYRFCLLILLFGLPFISAGQSKKKKPSSNSSVVTSNSAYVDMEKEKKKSSKRNIRYIYKTDPYRLLIGNRCVEEYTREMGFMYVLVLPDEDGDVQMGNFFNNVGTKFILTFTKGPFWGRKVKKKIEECRASSGDFVG